MKKVYEYPRKGYKIICPKCDCTRFAQAIMGSVFYDEQGNELDTDKEVDIDDPWRCTMCDTLAREVKEKK